MTPAPEPAKPRYPRELMPMMDVLLLAGTIVFVLMLVLISKWSPNDGQTFQVIAQLAGGFGAAFLTRAVPPKQAPAPDTKSVTIEKSDTTGASQ